MAHKRGGRQSHFREFGPPVFRLIIPDEVVESIAARHGADKRKRKIPVVVHLWLLVVAQIDSRARCLDALIRSVWEGWRQHLGLSAKSKGLDKAALSRKNSTRLPAIFRDIFEWLLKKHQVRFGGHLRLPAIGKNLAIIDSTVIDVASRLYRWFFNAGRHCKAGKAQVKVHMLYDADGRVPRWAEISRGSAHDFKWVKRLLRKAKSKTLFLFDRGYFSVNLFKLLVRRRHGFVTRLKENAVMRKVRRLGKGDWLVEFESDRKRPLHLRMVEWRTDAGEKLVFLTSLLDAKKYPREMIAELYVMRWEIETFFRDLKHVLRMKSFLSRSANGIRLEIYAALIAHVLMKYVRACAAEEANAGEDDLSLKRVVDETAIWLGAAPERCYRVGRKESDAQWKDFLAALASYGLFRKRKSASLAGKKASKRDAA